jgi:hypothetical protein
VTYFPLLTGLGMAGLGFWLMTVKNGVVRWMALGLVLAALWPIGIFLHKEDVMRWVALPVIEFGWTMAPWAFVSLPATALFALLHFPRPGVWANILALGAWGWWMWAHGAFSGWGEGNITQVVIVLAHLGAGAILALLVVKQFRKSWA